LSGNVDKRECNGDETCAPDHNRSKRGPANGGRPLRERNISVPKAPAIRPFRNRKREQNLPDNQKKTIAAKSPANIEGRRRPILEKSVKKPWGWQRFIQAMVAKKKCRKSEIHPEGYDGGLQGRKKGSFGIERVVKKKRRRRAGSESRIAWINP